MFSWFTSTVKAKQFQNTIGCQPQRPPWWPCPFQDKLWGWLLWPFCGCLSLKRLMNWLQGCCQCVCALGEGVPVTGGNPSYGIRPGAAYCGRPAGGPGGWWPREQLWPTYCCHTPGDTAALSSTRTCDWLRLNDSVWSAAVPQRNYLNVPNFSWWQD